MRAFLIAITIVLLFSNQTQAEVTTNKQKIVEYYIKLIRNDTSWLKLVEQKAIKQNLSVEKAIHNDAEFMYSKNPRLDVPLEKPKEPIFTCFGSLQLAPLSIGILFALLSMFFFFKLNMEKTSIVLLMFSGLSVRLFMVLLNGYINEWDEVVHALVAKNMMENPFHPMLFKNPIFPLDEFNWSQGHIWLHKQPLFLWQMALSMKIFGVSIFSIRFPSIIMTSILIYFIYRIGRLSFNQQVGYIAALLSVFSFYIMELIVGGVFTDHNDIAFLFYVCASFWAWVEYEKATGRKKLIFLILIGIFSGCAVLVKWLVGLLVYAGWGMSIILYNERRKQLKNYLHIGISLTITLIVFLPWQIYILGTFPTLSTFEYLHNSKHFFEVLEGHSGGVWYHFSMINELYGFNPFYLLIVFICFLVVTKNSPIKTAIITNVSIIYLFFTIAATKMPSFTFVVSFLIFIMIGVVISTLFELIEEKNRIKNNNLKILAKVSFLVILIIPMFNLKKIEERNVRWSYLKLEDYYFYKKQNNQKVITSLKKTYSNLNEYVVFNCLGLDNLSLMVFNDVVSAYSFIPSYKEYLKLKQSKYKILVLDNGKLPDYLLMDNEVIKHKSNYMW